MNKLNSNLKKIDKLHWLVLGLSLVVTIFAWSYSKRQGEEKLRMRFDREVDHVIELVKERMKKYEDALWSGSAFVAANQYEVGLNQWVRFSSEMRIDKKYPGINGIGIVDIISPDSLDDYLRNQRKDRADFNVFPKHDQSVLFPIRYIEPVALNKAAVGLDLAHENNRYTAAVKAQKTKLAQITGPIKLVQDKQQTPGFLFYVPLFKNNKAIGMVYAPFVVHKLIAGTLSPARRHVSFDIKDENKIIYQENVKTNKDYDLSPLLERKMQINLYGRLWSFDIQTGLSFREMNKTINSNLILICGIIIDILLLYIFLSLSQARQKALKFAQVKMHEAQQHKAMSLNSAKLASLGEMAAGVAHEINNPLTIISGNTYILKKEIESDTPNKDLIFSSIDKIEKTSFRIANIVNSMKSLSRDASNDSYKKLDISKVIDDSLGLCAEKFKATGVKLDSIKSTHQLFVKGNQVELSQVIINLLNNAYDAIKAKDNSWIKISLQKEVDNAVIRVIDSGDGIPLDIQENILKPFFTTKDVGEGTGLGLSISRKILHNHSGELEVDNELKNTCFKITIPLLTDTTPIS